MAPYWELQASVRTPVRRKQTIIKDSLEGLRKAMAEEERAHAQAALKQRREDLLASQLQARRPVMEAARSSRESLDERF